MLNRYSILLEKHMENIKSNKTVNLEPTMDTGIQNNGSPTANGKSSANNTVKSSTIIKDPDMYGTSIVNY